MLSKKSFFLLPIFLSSGQLHGNVEFNSSISQFNQVPSHITLNKTPLDYEQIINSYHRRFETLEQNLQMLIYIFETSDGKIAKHAEECEKLIANIDRINHKNITKLYQQLRDMGIALNIKTRLFEMVIKFMTHQINLLKNIKFPVTLYEWEFVDFIKRNHDNILSLQKLNQQLNDYWTHYYPQELFRLIKQNFIINQSTNQSSSLHQLQQIWKNGDKINSEQLGIVEPDIYERQFVDLEYEIVNISQNTGVVSVKVTIKYKKWCTDFFIVVRDFNVTGTNYLTKMQTIINAIKDEYSTTKIDNYLFDFHVGQTINVKDLGLDQAFHEINQKMIDLDFKFNYKVMQLDINTGFLTLKLSITKHNTTLFKNFRVFNFNQGQTIIKRMQTYLSQWNHNKPFDLNFQISTRDKWCDAFNLLTENMQKAFIDDALMLKLINQLTFEHSSTNNDQSFGHNLQQGDEIKTQGTFFLNKNKILTTTIYWKNLEIKVPIISEIVSQSFEVKQFFRNYEQEFKLEKTINFNHPAILKLSQNWTNLQQKYQTVTLFFDDLWIKKNSYNKQNNYEQNYALMQQNMTVKLNLANIQLNEDMIVQEFALNWKEKIMFLEFHANHNFILKLKFQHDTNNNLQLILTYHIKKVHTFSKSLFYEYSWKLKTIKWT